MINKCKNCGKETDHFDTVCSRRCRAQLRNLWLKVPLDMRPALPDAPRRAASSPFPRVERGAGERFKAEHPEERCCICGDLPTTKRHALDHNHLTGRIRGVLCVRCNLGLGNFRDDPRILELAIAYLKRADHYYDSGPAAPSRLSAVLKAP